MPIERLEGVTGSVAVKAPVRVATTAPILLSGLQTVDDIVLVPNDRVLVKDQVDTVANGIYTVLDGAWTRGTDFNGLRDAVRGTLIYVNEGTMSAEVMFRTICAVDPPTVGVHGLTFEAIAPVSGEAFADAAEQSAAEALASAQAAAISAQQAANSAMQAAISALIAANKAMGANFVPVGAVMLFANDAVPDDWLECNGIERFRDQYPDLFDAIGTTYGAGDGLNTFNIPDLRGVFVRGWDHGRGIDVARVIGTYQAQDIGWHNHAASVAVTGTTNAAGDHTHNVTINSVQINQQNPGSVFGLGQLDQASSFSGTYATTSAGSHSHSISIGGAVTVNFTGSETRPANVAMMYCIKAKGASAVAGIGWAMQTLADLTQYGGAMGTMGDGSHGLTAIGQAASGTVTGP